MSHTGGVTTPPDQPFDWHATRSVPLGPPTPITGPIPPQPTSRPPRRSHATLIVWLAVAVVALALAAGGIYLTTRPATFTGTGSATVHEITDRSCTGQYEFGVAAGASVTIRDPAGTVVAAGVLGPAAVSKSPAGVTICEFPFAVAGVPAGKVSYGVSVADNKPITFSEQELRTGAAKLGPVTQ